MSLHYAIRNKLLPEVRKLVEGGSDVNDKDDSKRTPLTMCCLEDDEKWALGVARMLLQAGAKVGITDKNGRSPLTFCVLFKRVDLCELFLRAIDFDLNQEDILGNTALHYSSLVGNLQICSLILSATLRSNLSINPRNKIGQTPAGLALIKHTNECYQLYKQTPNIEFLSKIPDVILTRPWMREREFVDCPDLMRKDATMDVLEGTKVHRSRPHLNVHQFRRGSAVPRSRKQRCSKR
uniref:Uncharacterized protein n=1 Tax=Ciona savignyi TaxID=51511 RepID=H2Z2L1_CIOSA